MPAAAEAPLKTPVAGFSASQDGRSVPYQVYVGLPPVAAKVWLYAVPTVAAGNKMLLIPRGAVW